MSAYAHEWKDGDVYTNLHTLFNVWPPHTFTRELTAWVNVIGNSNSGSHESIVLNHGELRNIAVTVNLDVIADLDTVVYRGAVPDVEIVADHALFTNSDVVTGSQSIADRGPAVDDTAKAYARIITNPERVILDLSTGHITKLDAIIYRRVYTQYYLSHFAAVIGLFFAQVRLLSWSEMI